jgi:hypothetical protein
VAHDLFGFIALWCLGYLCYWMGRRYEEDRWIKRLIGFAQELDEKAQEHRDQVERLPR